MTESALMTDLLNILPGWWPITGFRLEPISKMSFDPISLLVLRFKSSTYSSMPAVYDPQRF
jgi:hypothetical protein